MHAPAMTTRRTLLFAALAALSIGAVAGPPGGGLFGADRIDGQLERMAERLDLTTEQEAQVRAILDAEQARRAADRAEVRAQIDAVLTDAQRAQRDQAIAKRMDRRAQRLADELDLTADQQAEVRTILAEGRDDPEQGREAVRERIDAVLTPEQREQLADMRDRRGPGRGGPGGCPD